MTDQDPPTADELIERLVDHLAGFDEGAKSRELANKLDCDVTTVREHLVELERFGIVYRTGQTRGTRWWLG